MIKKVKSFLFSNQSVRQTVAKNTFWLTFGNVVGRLLRAGIVIYAARILGAADWGVFSYAIGIVALFTIFTDLGIRAVLIREVSRSSDPEMKFKIFSTSFFMEVFLLILSTLVVVFIAPHFTTLEGAREILIIALAVLAFDSLREFGFGIIRATEKMEQEAGIFILANFAIAILGFIFLQFSPTAKSFMVSYVIGTGVGTLAAFYAIRGYFKKILSNFSKKMIKPILTWGWPFAISAMLGGLLINIDILVIGFFRTAEEVGFYSAALRPIQLLYIIPSILAISIFPALSRLADKEKDRARAVIEKSITAIFMVAIPMALGGMVLGRGIMGLLFGDEYLPGVSSFQILALTMMVNFPAVILSDSIFAHNRQKLLITFVAIGGILNIILDFALIPKFGIVGSAWTTLIAQTVSNIYLWQKMKQINYFKIFPFLGRIIPAGILMALFALGLSILEIPVLAIIGLSVLLYFGVLYAMKEPMIGEVKAVISSRF